jgi:AcrR family transcriptional regulator
MMARPRNAANDDAILAAATTTLAEGGYDALVIDDLARRVGVAKTTVYRRWPTKNHLVASVLAVHAAGAGAAPSEGLEPDLVRHVVRLGDLLADPATRRMVAELLAAGIREPALRTLAEPVWLPWRTEAGRLVEEGVRSGAARTGADAGTAVDQLAGAVQHRALVTGEPVDRRYAEQLVADVLDGLRPHRRDGGQS